MASTDLTPAQPRRVVDGGGPNDPSQAGPLIRRPAELVELAEAVYRGVFGAGLVVASIATVYATVLGTLQPAGHRTVGVAVCSVLLLAQLLAIYQRRRLYAVLRRWPWLVLAPAVAVGVGAWATGSHNQQLFYVLTISIGVLGAAVPLRVVLAASLVAAAGMAGPHMTDGSWTVGVAVAAGILPPLFWLIVEQFARFILRLHQTHEPTPNRRPKRVQAWVDRPPSAGTPPAASTAHDEEPSNNGRVPLDARGADLTARQLEVVLLCAEGLKHDEIGSCLEIGAVQVGRHLRKACCRAGVGTNAELMAWAIGRGLIPRDDPSRSLVGDPQALDLPLSHALREDASVVAGAGPGARIVPPGHGRRCDCTELPQLVPRSPLSPALESPHLNRCSLGHAPRGVLSPRFAW